MWLLDDLLLTSAVNLKDPPLGGLLSVAYIDPEVAAVVLLLRPIMAIPALSATAPRFHDVDISGWWSCFWVVRIPVAGWFWFIQWLLRPSQKK